MTTIDLDWTRCDAHGLCSRLLPEKITLDEWGFPILDGRELDPELVRPARAAALACPALALRVSRKA
ncbi:ferredoxin [Aeromicrobium sp. A1-2]|uniref:ferredoxin n=1 Tax=Aeromicrobium sp. A1-2 TaxID=2107713 RepID=UPI000E4C1054|nr:ferredoxin [Aeromicrobium sp. A1-2]AXT85141.1 ferredoxin [Aeromicrobium sp. A1-2]